MPRPTHRQSALAAVGRILAVTLAVLLSVGGALTLPAHAHAGLVSTDPAEGSKLDAAPTEVTLTFNEAVRAPAFIVVTAPDGKQQELDEPVIDGEVVTQALDPGTEAAIHPGGAWTIAYRVVSDDGHTVQGHVRFRVTGEAPSPSQSTDAPESEAAQAPRANGNDASDEGSSTNTAAIVVASSLAVLLAVVTLVQARRRRA